MAIGAFDDTDREQARACLVEFDAGLRRGDDSEAICARLPPRARACAEQAVLLIRKFEQQVGQECGAQVSNNSCPGVRREHSISLENRDAMLFGHEVQALAQGVAELLQRLLEAFGGVRTTIEQHILDYIA